jgi:hypothetical protein
MFLKDLFWDPRFSVCLTTNDIQLTILTSADDMKIYGETKSPEEGNTLQSDVNSIQGWLTINCMKLDTVKAKVTPFSCKTNILTHKYKLRESSVIIGTNYITDTRYISGF